MGWSQADYGDVAPGGTYLKKWKKYDIDDIDIDCKSLKLTIVQVGVARQATRTFKIIWKMNKKMDF